jgi:hypothetical protein
VELRHRVSSLNKAEVVPGNYEKDLQVLNRVVG